MKIGIVAHVRRQEQAVALQHRVDADVVHYDDGYLGCTENHKSVWKLLFILADEGEWCIVLEDDAVVPDYFTFRNQLGKILAHAPADVVSLYLGQSRPPQWQRRIVTAISAADKTNSHYITADAMLHAVGIAMKANLIQEFIETSQECNRPIDESFTYWLRSTGRQCAYTWPSLIDHADGTTLENHPDGQPRVKGRIAWNTGTRTTWSKRSVEL